MESWSNPAHKTTQGSAMTANRGREPQNVDPELLTRTSWVNAEIAYRQILKGKINGNVRALWLRSHLQRHLYSAGCFIQLHSGKVLFVALLLLSLCCVGLKTSTIETNVEELWVEEGGRLEEELAYTREKVGEGSGTTSEIVIQTPKTASNILTVESLQLHLQALLKVTQIEVKMYDIRWTFKDLCYSAEFPSFESTIDDILDSLMPCVITTPLDCFWEGAKVLGPANSVFISQMYPSVKWTNLNPIQMADFMKDYGTGDIEKAMDRAGIGTAYQEKPCLNPLDPDCPMTAPNKNSPMDPDIGAELTNGCYGFATKFMHWEEDLIVGGVRKNKTGHIVRAEALQSVIQLMGEKNMYEYYADQYKTFSIDWTQEKAKAVLEAWQRKFTEEVNKISNATSYDDVYAFSTTSLMDIMRDFSNLSIVRVALGYVLMVVYACISLLRWHNAVNSQSGIGIAGVLLVVLSVGAGLGICSILGISFNASTTQIIPFLALGLGVDDMFLIAHTYAENAKNNNIPYLEQTGECLRRTGVSVLLTSVSNMLAFFSAAIIPIPALRAFSLQAGILLLFNLGTVLLVFPAVCSLDLVRRENKRIDVFCCFQSASAGNVVIELQNRGSQQSQHHEASPPPSYAASPPCYSPPPPYNTVHPHDTITQTSTDGQHPVTTLAPNDGVFVHNFSLNSVCPSTTSSRQCLTPEENVTCKDRCVQAQRECLSSSLTCLATRYYGPFLKKTSVKVFTIVFFIVFLILGIWGTVRVKDGLDMTDVVPKDTPVYNFLETQSKYFGFYNIYLTTKEDFDYPNNQALLYEYHKAFQRVDRIIKREDGTLPNFWLDLFRQWLQGLQDAFDKDYREGKITYSLKGYTNASHQAILAYKLLAQTGDVDDPVDKDRIINTRLVDANGIINPKVFYNYLTAWSSNDALAFTASMANFVPEPKSWIHDYWDHDFLIPKSQPITFAQIPFYLSNLSNTEEILDTIIEIRSICDSFSDKGLPNYPSGIPFTFWEQYINLRFYLMMALFCVLAVTFIVLTFVMMSPWAAGVVVVVLSLIVVELFGFMGLIGIKLSAVPAVILIVAVGIGMEFTLHVTVGFVTAIGSRNKRMLVSLEHTFAPVVHGAISTLLGIIMLVGAEFDFIVKYFFNVLVALIAIGVLNGLLLLPVLLSICGPKAEVQPKDDADKIPTPTPEPSPRPRQRERSHSRTFTSRHLYPRVPSDISLSTITEEPSQYSSHEIIIQPEVIIETTTVPARVTTTVISNGNSSNNCSQDSEPQMFQSKHVTRVKATATVKVEVHTPLPGAVNQEHSYKSKRRKLKELESSDSDSKSSSDC